MCARMTEDEFSEWYNRTIEEAELSDKRYPVKGMNVWTPYGWRIMSNIDNAIRREMDATGHGEVCFPLLVPATEFEKEAQHIKGFSDEVYWVTRAGGKDLDVPLLLRPTSETAMYPIFKLWVRSHADLPLKTYQIVNTFRYDTKMTRSFIRVREIHFFEAHTCHVDFEDAERQIAENLEIWSRVSRDLALPYLTAKRPDWDKFPGAFYTIGFDILMPSGRTMQMASVHQYKTNFSEPYDITYEDENGEHQHVHQTTYGMSERLVGAIIGVHGDEKGPVLPPAIAPHQVVVVPIFKKDDMGEVLEAAKALAEELDEAGIRVHMDDRDLRPGEKFYHWERRGVPIRLELGPRDIKHGQVTMAVRDTGDKSQVRRDDVIGTIETTMADMQYRMLDKAEKDLRSRIKDMDDIPRDYEIEDIIRVGWCGEEHCATQIEEELEVTFLGEDMDLKTPPMPRCTTCGGTSINTMYVSKTY
ncbi:MAG: proline--tRNA ligase [Thermoplasmata archaeon]|nr:proline--tRNA ligase [Thermoplasmata archaeon]